MASLQRTSFRGSLFKYTDWRTDRYTVLQHHIVAPNGCDPRHRLSQSFSFFLPLWVVQYHMHMRLTSPVHEALCRRTFQLVLHFLVLSQNCETRLPASSCLSVCMGQLGYCWSEFHETLYFTIFRKSVEEIQVSLKSVNNNGYFTRRSMYNIRSVLLRMRSVSEKVVEKITAHILCSNFFSPKTVSFVIMWKNMVEPDRSQMTIWYGACALHAG